jgi:hypothetical protein
VLRSDIEACFEGKEKIKTLEKRRGKERDEGANRNEYISLRPWFVVG